MARQVQIIKGTTEQNNGFTGAEGVLTYDSDKKDIRIHDGTTAGGFEIPSAAMADYVIYWDSADSSDHSHAKPGVPTPTNNGWYRIYKSGWCEQGKFRNFMESNVNTTCMLIIPMKDTNYFVTGVYDTGTAALYSYSRIGVGAKTTQSFQMRTDGGMCSWEVKGYANSAEYTPDK